MAVKQYIGARYVPEFANPLDWDNSKTYEPLTIVYHEGNSYTSRQSVPTGIGIDNTEYWALTGNYNAQIEQYRQEVQTFDERITTNANAITAINADGWVTADRIADGAITSGKIAADAVTGDAVADGAITSGKIADGAITSGKIADGAITSGKIAADAVTGDAVARRHMVVIGDSYSTTGYTPTEDQLWWNLVAERKGYVPHNYAVTATGFLDTTSPNFRTQVQNAADDGTYSNGDVAAVYILGGLNDVKNIIAGSYTADQVAAEVKSVLELAKTTFANAEIIFGSGETWQNLENNAQNSVTVFRTTQKAALESGVKVIKLTTTLLGEASYFQSSDGHPNALGQQALASAMLGSGECAYRKLGEVTATKGTTNLSAHIRSGWVWFSGNFTTDENGKCTFTCPSNIDRLFYPSITAVSTESGIAWMLASGSNTTFNGKPSTQYYCYRPIVDL